MQGTVVPRRRSAEVGLRAVGTTLVVALALVAAMLPPAVADADDGVVEVKLFATNDFHGRLLPPSGPLGGAAYLATHLAEARASSAYTLHVDAGDLVGATPVLSNLFFDEPTVEAMNIIGLDIQTVGNHEFDRGQDELLRRRDGGCRGDDCDYRGGLPFDGQDFTTLSSNVIVTATGEALTLARDIVSFSWAPTTISECQRNGWRAFPEMSFRNQGQCVSYVASQGRAGGQGNPSRAGGVDIGFVGVTTINTPNVVSPTGIVGLEFQSEAEAVNREVASLQAEGADVIVVLMHEGGRQGVATPDPNGCENFTGAAASIIPEFSDAVDVVVTGHTHQSYVCDFEDGPLVTQAFEYGKRFTEITLGIDLMTGMVASREAVNHDVTRDVVPHPEVEALITKYQELAGPALREVVGTSEVAIRGDRALVRGGEAPLGNLATDALIDQYGTDFAFQNGGGLRADLTDDGSTLDPPGPPDLDDEGLWNIRRENVLRVWPFGNIVALAEVDGPLLKAILDNGVAEIGGGRMIQVAGLRIDYYLAEGTRGEIANVEYWNHPDFPNGTPVDLSPSASYTIALNDFMAAGGDFYPALGDRVFSLQDPLEIAIERYLDANSPVNPQIEGRIVQIPGP